MRIEIGGGDKSLDGYVQVDLYGAPQVRADIRALPFKRVDRIFASHVLEHLPDADIVTALKSVRRALREDGVFEAYVPDLPWFMRKFLKASAGERWSMWNVFIFGSQENEGQYHKTGFSVKRLSDCLVAAGFRKIDVKQIKRSENMGLMEVHAVARA